MIPLDFAMERYNAITGFGSIIASGVASMSLCLAAAIPESSFVTDTQMRFACIAGALGGAILSVLIFPPRQATHRTVAAKFFASGISGVIFSPLVLQKMGWAADFNSVLAVSAIVALIAIGVLRTAVPIWEKLAIRQMSGKDDNKTES